MINYTYGLSFSLLLGAILGLGTYFYIGKDNSYINIFTDYSYRFLISTINFFALSLLLYCSINTVFNVIFNFNLIFDNEIKNGIFFNRFISIYISFLCLKYNTSDSPLKYIFSKPFNGHGCYKEGDRSLVVVSQYSIYITTFYIIWYFTYEGVSNNYMVFLVWILVFIIDDWSIMVGYLHRDGDILKEHKTKISIVNFIIILLSIIVISIGFNIVAVLLYCILMIFILSFRYNFEEYIFHRY